MINFCVPSDFKLESLQLYHSFNLDHPNHQISEVYGQETVGKFTASGRMIGALPTVNLSQLQDYIQQCIKYNINFNYTINPSCIDYSQFSLYDIREYVKQLYQIGIRHFTVTLPNIIEIVQSMGSDIYLKASAICEISSLRKAAHYVKNAAARIVVDPDITKDFRILRSICDKYADRVEIIVNNMCMRDCPYKMFHYNHEAHSSGSIESQENRYYHEKCTAQKSSALDNYIKLNWIRPEDLHYYEELGIHYYKIQGRNHPNGENVYSAVKAYVNGVFEGNLVDLLTLWNPYNVFQPYIDNRQMDGYLEPFVHKDGFCKGMCQACRYCMSYAEKSINLSEYAKVAEYANKMYK